VSNPPVSRLAAGTILLLLGLPLPRGVAGQVEIQDLVFTGGAAMEWYRGNLSTVTLPVVDSAESVGAVVGQVSGTIDLRLLGRTDKSLDLTVDSGLRQFVTWGWSARDYVPREMVATGNLDYRQDLSWGSINAGLYGRGRWIHDRPPIPVYIEPGYGRLVATLGTRLLPIRDVRFDASVVGELADYAAEPSTPQLDLLDRESLGMEVGAQWGRDWDVRFFGAFHYYRYPKQGTFDPDDPARRDKLVRGGVEFTTGDSDYFGQLGVEGILNRSNSARPEYNAVAIRGVFAVPLSEGMTLNAYGQFTDKQYLQETGFALVVPGEEADNASALFLQVTRRLASNMDGSLRLGWARAESNIADEYFERFSGTFLLTYRPRWYD
jgi:hypothetical protein